MKFGIQALSLRSLGFGLLGVGVAIFTYHVVYGQSPQFDTQVGREEVSEVELITTQAAESDFAYPVVGTVTAKHELIVRARTAGVVEAISVHEGSVVAPGETMLMVFDPVRQARLSRQDVQNLVTTLREESVYIERERQAATAVVGLTESTGLRSLSAAAETERVTSLTEQVRTGLESLGVSLPVVFRFVQDNKTMFTGESLELYQASVSAFYGSVPDYFRVNSLAAGNQTLAARLTDTRSATTTDELLSLVEETLQELESLAQVFTESEVEFLDRGQLSTTDDAYIQYNTTRRELLALKESLQTAEDGLASLVDMREVNQLSREGAVATAEIGSAAAATQLGLSGQLLSEIQNLSEADRTVLLAEISLGIERAPYTGVITEVLVEPGEYVQPGTPLLVIVGAQEQEVVVHLPEEFLSRVEIGAPVLEGGEVVGSVSRVVPVAEAGSVRVYVEFTKAQPLGVSWRGAISLKTDNLSEYTVNRSELFFAVTGPYVVTESGKKIEVEILYDEGTTLHVRPTEAISEPLKPAFGLRL
jgi:multidrug resistance efflux pump